MKELKEIYKLVGQIIEQAQLIEWNLAYAIQMSIVLKEFDEKETISNSRYNELQNDAKKLRKRMETMVLGKIIQKAKDIERFNDTEIIQLEEALEIRNYYAHNFFKKEDLTEADYGQKMDVFEDYKNIEHMNNVLIKIVQRLEREMGDIVEVQI